MSSASTGSIPPPDGDVNRAPQLLLALWLTTAISIAFLIARIYVRLRLIKYHGWDDYWLTGSVLVAILGCALETVSVRFGFGRHEFYLTSEQIVQATKYNMVAIPPNLFSSAMAKISVCLFLTHLKQDRMTGYFLYTMAVILFTFSTATSILLLTQCQPVQALWDKSLLATGQGHCLDPSVNGNVGLAQSVFFCVADILVAFFPLTFLWRLQMNMRTKAALGFVLSLGLMAGAFGIVRCVALHEITTRSDILFATVDLATWSFLEQNVTVIAACIPALYTVVRSWLGRLSSNGGSSSGGRLTSGGRNNTGGSRRLKSTYDSSYGRGNRLDWAQYQELDCELHGMGSTAGVECDG